MSDYLQQRVTKLEEENRVLSQDNVALKERIRNGTLYVAAAGYQGKFRDTDQRDALILALHHLTGQPQIMCDVLFTIKPSVMK